MQNYLFSFFSLNFIHSERGMSMYFCHLSDLTSYLHSARFYNESIEFRCSLDRTVRENAKMFELSD